MASPSILRRRVIQFTDVLLMSSHPNKPEDTSNRQKKIHRSGITDLDLRTCGEAISSILSSTWLWYLAGWFGVRALPRFGSGCEKSHPPSSSCHSQSWSVCSFPCGLKDDSTPLDCWEHPAEAKIDLVGSHTSRLPLCLPRPASPLEWPQRGTQADCDNKDRSCRTHMSLLEVSPKPELSAYKEHGVIYILTTVSSTSPPYRYSSCSQSSPHADHELMHLSHLFLAFAMHNS
ncbi:uncharacterized protein [Sinocyclocheilus grahami]|uniref:uncharacterized protein n=1 Tax=Sinocyclocheilus grahami TaxID=75366 RepID=UPI0007ACBC81|nr:PREDICTED: uncharacterized protein LOC107595255 [Sinocyclocheilus grahami]